MTRKMALRQAAANQRRRIMEACKRLNLRKSIWDEVQIQPNSITYIDGEDWQFRVIPLPPVKPN